MENELIEKLKEVIQQHADLTNERVIGFSAEWVLMPDGDYKLLKIRLDIEK